MDKKINCFVSLNEDNIEYFNKALEVTGALFDAAKESGVEKPEVRIKSEYSGIEVNLTCVIPEVKNDNEA